MRYVKVSASNSASGERQGLGPALAQLDPAVEPGCGDASPSGVEHLRALVDSHHLARGRALRKLDRNSRGARGDIEHAGRARGMRETRKERQRGSCPKESSRAYRSYVGPSGANRLARLARLRGWPRTRARAYAWARGSRRRPRAGRRGGSGVRGGRASARQGLPCDRAPAFRPHLSLVLRDRRRAADVARVRRRKRARDESRGGARGSEAGCLHLRDRRGDGRRAGISPSCASGCASCARPRRP